MARPSNLRTIRPGKVSNMLKLLEHRRHPNENQDGGRRVGRRPSRKARRMTRRRRAGTRRTRH
jgi:hypothetical protein